MIPVDLRCPACGYQWRFAQIHPGAWWARGVTPQQQAAVPYCPECAQPPPMQVVDVQPLLAGLKEPA